LGLRWSGASALFIKDWGFLFSVAEVAGSQSSRAPEPWTLPLP
jgi:hypothetical protein